MCGRAIHITHWVCKKSVPFLRTDIEQTRPCQPALLSHDFPMFQPVGYVFSLESFLVLSLLWYLKSHTFQQLFFRGNSWILPGSNSLEPNWPLHDVFFQIKKTRGHERVGAKRIAKIPRWHGEILYTSWTKAPVGMVKTIVIHGIVTMFSISTDAYLVQSMWIDGTGICTYQFTCR